MQCLALSPLKDKVQLLSLVVSVSAGVCTTAAVSFGTTDLSAVKLAAVTDAATTLSPASKVSWLKLNAPLHMERWTWNVGQHKRHLVNIRSGQQHIVCWGVDVDQFVPVCQHDVPKPHTHTLLQHCPHSIHTCM